jgi:hypothetical protein
MEHSSTTPPASPARFWLGMLQMAGAAFTLALWLSAGISTATIAATVITTAIALASFLSRRGWLNARRARRA